MPTLAAKNSQATIANMATAATTPTPTPTTATAINSGGSEQCDSDDTATRNATPTDTQNSGGALNHHYHHPPVPHGGSHAVGNNVLSAMMAPATTTTTAVATGANTVAASLATFNGNSNLNVANGNIGGGNSHHNHSHNHSHTHTHAGDVGKKSLTSMHTVREDVASPHPPQAQLPPPPLTQLGTGTPTASLNNQQLSATSSQSNHNHNNNNSSNVNGSNGSNSNNNSNGNGNGNANISSILKGSKGNDEENLRQQCENASLEDKPLPARKAVLPPIKLGMSFSDWKQMKESEEDNKISNSSRSAKDRKFPGQQRQNPHNKIWTSESHIQNQQNKDRIFFRSQQKNLPKFNALTSQRNKLNVRSFQEDPIIPPLMPPLSFDEFLNQDVHWSSGPLMQPLFPPMPRMPRLNQINGYNNQSEKFNNKFFPQKKFPSQTQSNYGDSAININTQLNQPAIKSTQNEEQNTINTRVVDDNNTNVVSDSKQQPQIYIQRPRNLNNKYDKFKYTWMVKPQAPPPMVVTSPEDRELKTRLWREYRHAMKPFRNREFKNAKRVVQRLGKKKYEELDEKDRVRLDRAVEAVNAHKEMLNARMVERSARVEREIKNDISDTKHSTSENFFNLPANWHLSNSLNKKNPNIHDPVLSSRQSISESFLPGGVLLP